MSTVLKAVAEPPEARAESWHETVASHFVGMDLRLDGPPDTRDQIAVGEIGPVHVMESCSGPGQAWRTPRHIRRDEVERYVLFMQVTGSTVSEQGGRCSRHTPGDFGLVNLSQPLQCAYTERRAVLVSWPKALTPLREGEVEQLTTLRSSNMNGAGALVANLVRQLPRCLHSGNGAESARIGSAVLDLVTAGLASHLEREADLPAETRSQALLLRCRAFIEDHLGDADLGPRKVAAAHHISLRYLHRLFEPTGDSVVGLIRRRRLDRCRRDLLHPDCAGLPVCAIGARWGMPRASYFTRAFKSVYGMPPGEYRAVYGTVRNGD